MRLLFATLLALVLSLSSTIVSAQTPQEQSVPRLITISGVYRPADARPPAAVETVTLSVYADQQGGTPLFQETQQVTLDDRGRYSVVLGAAHTDGIPPAIFAAGAQWLGTVFERPGEVEGPRTQLTSVPYSLRAADADTLGGRPASDYVLTPSASGGTTEARATAGDTGGVSNDVVQPGTTNFLAKYVNTADVGSSGIFEAADGSVGLGTTTPFDRIHVRYNNNTGDFTGLAVQNMNGGALAYSGMLFFDHTNALTQFQGYNNLTHEYRINNISRVSPGGAFNGTINFMIGGTSKFFVGSNGGVGIGTTSAGPGLEVSNSLTGAFTGNISVSTYGSNAFGGTFAASKARGTQAAPTAVLNGDQIALFAGVGQAATHPGAFGNGMEIKAAENYTDTAQGTALNFFTTTRGTNTPTTRMTIGDNGNIGIGTTTPSANLEVSNAVTAAANVAVVSASFSNTNLGSIWVARKARGTATAPAAVQSGDNLAVLSGRGYGATNFGAGGAVIVMRATENFSDTAQGTMMQFQTTQNATNVVTPRMTINHDGSVGIGTTSPQTILDLARTGASATVSASSFGVGASGFRARAARGTQTTPTAIQFGDELGEYAVGGYGATSFNETGGFAAFAAENWTDVAQGTTLGFFSTPIGSNQAQLRLGLLDNGNIGIGTPEDLNGFPTATDKLQVFGDARVGNGGTNGCLKNFAGTGIAGTCASDRRFKKDITPFGPVLNQLIALQPVHYYWRAEEFPARHFGNSRAYGLIAQDVEQILPELVATDGDGYKAVDYSELPLLTIGAVKELKAENDALKQRVAELERRAQDDPVKQRIAELERLVADLLAAGARR
jgi:Chaperone of endosialidase